MGGYGVGDEKTFPSYGGYAGNSSSDAGGEKSEPCRGHRDLWLVKVFEQSALAPSVSGMAYVDVDGDCKYDPMIDSPLANRLVEATPGPYFAQSGSDGQFRLRLPSGDYSIAQPNPAAGTYTQTCPAPAATFPVTAVSGTLTTAGKFGNKGPAQGIVALSTVGVYTTPATSPCWDLANVECVTFSNENPTYCTSPTYTIQVNGGISGAQVTGAMDVTLTPACNCTPTVTGNTVSCNPNIGASLASGDSCEICVTVNIPAWMMGTPPSNQMLTIESAIDAEGTRWSSLGLLAAWMYMRRRRGRSTAPPRSA